MGFRRLGLCRYRAVAVTLAAALSCTSLAHAQGMGGMGGGMGGAMGGGPAQAFNKPLDDDGKPKKKMIRLPSWLGGPDEKLAQQLHDQGKQLMAEGQALLQQKQPEQAKLKFKEAVSVLYKAQKRSVDFAIEEDVLFLLGEAYFFNDQYPRASDIYQTLFKKFSNTRYTQQVVAHQFLIARYWEQINDHKSKWSLVPNMTDRTRPTFDDYGNALSLYQSIQTNDPTGPLADDAAMAAANRYFVQGQYDEAAHYYGRLRKEHPRSEHQPKAHLLGMQSEMARYQGARYDGTPLSEVDKLAKVSFTQFPQELEPERENLLRMQEEVRAQKAHRDFQMGEYYYNIQQYGSAKFYYNFVLRDYPDTEFAVVVRERMQAMQGKPDVPPVKFPWLVKMFGESKKKQ